MKTSNIEAFFANFTILEGFLFIGIFILICDKVNSSGVVENLKAVINEKADEISDLELKLVISNMQVTNLQKTVKDLIEKLETVKHKKKAIKFGNVKKMEMKKGFKL